MLLAILSTALATGLVTVVLLNLRAGEKQIRHELRHEWPVEHPQFLRSMGNLLGVGLLSGNRVQALHNGVQIFPAMLEAIRGARGTITFETYIYWSGEVGREFSAAFSERARAGIKVHVMLDWAGSAKMDAGVLRDLEAAGVAVEQFHPLRWYNLARLNNRTHRKLLVVDGRIGFTGGVGIADLWQGDADSSEHWRDTHFRIEGPAVAQMQAAFTDNWIKTRGEVLCGSLYFPELHPVGGSRAQVFKSSRSEGSESVRLMYLLSITSAVKHIRLQSSYFVPDEMAIEAFVAARARGVRVEIIVPGPHMDSKVVQRASRALWGALLDAGVEIYEFQTTMYHCKVLIVDDVWVSVGSTNFDDRSFRLNDEANLNIYDAAFARELVEVFEQDRRSSRAMTRTDLRERSSVAKALDTLACTVRRQL